MTHPFENLHLKLGRNTDDAGLDAVPRDLSRGRLHSRPAWQGYDLWNAYEVSFLLPGGKPAVYHLQARYDADTPCIVESKSFKLFLNSFNMQVVDGPGALCDLVRPRLEACVGGAVELTVYGPEESPGPHRLDAPSLDQLTPTRIATGYDPELLTAEAASGAWAFKSHLLRSNCPVTNQPDWGTLWVRGEGARRPVPESLLAYIIAMRNHQDFHEACCESVFADLHRLLAPERLQVACFYTRRGGLDINPLRATHAPEQVWRAPLWRQ